MLQAIGASLPAAMAVALSPFPVIGIVLILAGRHGRRSGAAFTIGWLAGLSIVAALVVSVFGGADDPDSTSSAFADWSRVVAGAALIALGIRKWLRRPRAGEEVETPSWMASLDQIAVGRALLLGVLTSGANPKNFVLTASAVTSMIEAGVHDADMVAAVAVYVLLGSFTVLGALLAHIAGGARGEALLDSVRQFMVTNSATIMVVILLLLGANVLGGGLEGLGR